MLKAFVAAAALSLAAVMPAAAGPIVPAAPLNAQVSSDVVQVQHHHHHRRPPHHAGRHRGHGHPPVHYRAGHRYNSAPSHYRRYHSRPADWSRRGCIMVGPLWMCP